MAKLHIKTNDTVVVLSGDDKVKIGTVFALSPEDGKVIVSGVHTVSKHTKARRQGESSQIIKTEGAIYASKVQLVCPKCDTGVRTKVAVVDGKKVRTCAKCGAEI